MKKNPGPTHADFGSDRWNREHGLTHGPKKRSDQANRARAHYRKAAASERKLESAAERTWAAAWKKVLGPTGKARAIKITSLRGHFTAADLEAYREAGWNVLPAGSAPAKLGPLVNPETDENTAILGPTGRARSIVLGTATASIDKDVVRDFLESGYEVSQAPKRFREPVQNPTPTAKAIKKAKAWYRREDLVTEPELLKGYHAPKAVVEVGELLAIEYASTKFEGKLEAYRHEVTQTHRLFLSPDGSTLIVDPPFRITTRGIEG